MEDYLEKVFYFLPPMPDPNQETLKTSAEKYVEAMSPEMIQGVNGGRMRLPGYVAGRPKLMG